MLEELDEGPQASIVVQDGRRHSSDPHWSCRATRLSNIAAGPVGFIDPVPTTRIRAYSTKCGAWHRREIRSSAVTHRFLLRKIGGVCADPQAVFSRTSFSQAGSSVARKTRRPFSNSATLLNGFRKSDWS